MARRRAQAVAVCTAGDGVAVIRLERPKGLECVPAFALEPLPRVSSRPH
jgi:hypothetical protein